MGMRNVGIGLGLLVSFIVGCGGASAPKAASSPSSSSPSSAMADESGGAPAQPGYASPAMEEAAATGAATPSPAPPPPSSPAATSAGASKKSADMDVARSAEAKPAAPIAREPERVAPLPQAGQLTAGVWDDNRNFDFWKPYQTKMMRSSQDNALFGDQELLAARDAANAQQTPHTDLDVQLLLDTTGSMGDELEYLQSEFDAIAAQLKTRFPNVTPRWSLVVYRDHGDEYVTRTFDFTSDTKRFRADLRAQSAAGGGDTPEAVVEGMKAGLAQSWRPAPNVAKISFWVADAPAHPGEGRALAAAVRAAKQKGVHVYPIASSDTDDTAEYQMRSAAQMTGGRYVFLTNDSGIGNSHAEPHIPCYNVTRLDDAIVRMISVELSGRYVEAEPNKVVRSVGRPNKEGKCQLSSGMLVASF